jgi:hypothetical protein
MALSDTITAVLGVCIFAFIVYAVVRTYGQAVAVIARTILIVFVIGVIAFGIYLLIDAWGVNTALSIIFRALFVIAVIAIVCSTGLLIWIGTTLVLITQRLYESEGALQRIEDRLDSIENT